MKRTLRTALFAVALAALVNGASAQPLGDLLQKVSSAPDFRVRVQAALELGKTKGRAARIALESALDDENAAVRAAAAAGLKVMRDPQAIVALEKHETDSSPAVRAQIKNSIETLRLADSPGKAEEKPELVVQVGKMRSSNANGAVEETVARASKIHLRELPGIAVVDEGDEPTPARRHIPTVMVTGRVKQLEASRDGASMTYRASIEFVLHKMPGQTIKGVVTGSARASGAVSSGEDGARSIADLRKSAIEAAVESAVRRAPQALRAAAQ